MSDIREPDLYTVAELHLGVIVAGDKERYGLFRVLHGVGGLKLLDLGVALTLAAAPFRLLDLDVGTVP